MVNLKSIALYSLFVLFAFFLISCDWSENTSQTNPSEESKLPIEDYEQARVIFWNELYAQGGTSLYCNAEFQPDRRHGFNVEHVFPMSWVTKALACGTRNQCRDRSDVFNRIEADLHNLFPTLTKVNAARSFYRFAEIEGERREFGKSCDFEIDKRRRLAEPREEIRGDIARAMFYMAHQHKEHGLEIFAQTGRVLQQWHQDDPPGREEQKRNDRIEKLQGNRNPFIDDPEQLNVLIEQRRFY